MKRTPVVQSVVAGVALVGAVLSWLAAGSQEHVPPVLEGQPTMTTMVYYPPLVVLALLLLAASGVLAVLGFAGRRRSRRAVGQNTIASRFDRPIRG